MSPAEIFLATADLLPEPMLLLDSSGRIEAANRAFTHHHGADAAPHGAGSLQALVLDPPAAIAEYLLHCLRSGQMVPGALALPARSCSAPIAYRCEGMRYRYAAQPDAKLILLRLSPRESRLAPFTALNEKISQLNREIERRKAVEETLRDERETLAVTLASIGDAVVVTDASGRATYLNAVAERLTGWPLEAARGRPLPEILRIVNETTREPAGNPVEQVLETGRVVGLASHAVLIRRDGSEVAIDDSAAPIRSPSLGLLGVVLIFRDISERRRVEQALLASEALYRTIGEAAPDFIAIRDLQGRAEYVNGRWLEYTGLSLEELNESLETLIHPDDRAALQERWAEAAGTGASFEAEYRLRRRDGAYRWFWSRAVPLKDAEGRVLKWVGASSDITARKHAEEASARLAVLVEHSGDAILGMSTSGLIESWNRAAESLFGYSAAEIIGQPVSVLAPPDRRAEQAEVMARLRAGQYVRAFETARLTKSGEAIDVLLTSGPVRDASGAITGFSAVLTDIRARKRVEQALRRAEERMRSVVDHVVDGILTIDCTGRIESLNPAAERLFGYAREQLLGQNVKMLMPEPYRSEHDQYLQRYLSGGPARIIGLGREVLGRRRDGSTFPMELAVSEFSIGAERYFTGIVRDISERKRAEAHRELLMRELAHRVKNTLAVVQSIASQTARAGEGGGSVEEFRSAFSARLQALARAHDLLLHERWQAVSLERLLEQTLRPFLASPGRRRVWLAGPAVAIEAQVAVSLSMVLHELATNAAKYGALSGEAGEVHVRWRVLEGAAIELAWSERGGPPVVAPTRTGFGSRLIQSLSRELGEPIELAFAPEGVQCRLRVPLAASLAELAASSA